MCILFGRCYFVPTQFPFASTKMSVHYKLYISFMSPRVPLDFVSVFFLVECTKATRNTTNSITLIYYLFEWPPKKVVLLAIVRCVPFSKHTDWPTSKCNI